ncbi:hypothetical protein MBLNU457_6645t1 [Dothideomycetes sp. NU457]
MGGLLSLVHSTASDAYMTVTRSTTDAPASLLLQSIKTGAYWKLDDNEALQLLAEAFEPEFKALLNSPAAAEQAASASGHANSHTRPSMRLFGQVSDEIDRTITGVLCMKWVLTGDYEHFIQGQDSKLRMSRASFEKFQELCRETLRTSDDMFGLLTATVVNDLGKDTTLAARVEQATGKSMLKQNHDVVLYEAVKADLVSCMHELNSEQRDCLVIGLKMGSRLNLGQLAQAENVPGSLDVMIELKGHEHAFELKFLEQLFDVAGAAGHVDATCSKSMIEPVFQAFMTVHKVLSDILHDRSSPREAYDEVLTQRADIIANAGYRRLTVKTPEDRALLRLMTMGRTANKDQAAWFEQAFNSLVSDVKDDLVKGLSVDGWKDGKAILPYYMPALLQAGLKNTKDESASAKSNALASMMRFLTKILAGTYPTADTEGLVVEHDLLFAKEMIVSPEFKMDPSVLDALPVNTTPTALAGLKI